MCYYYITFILCITSESLKAARPPFGLESAIDFDTPSDTNARRPSQKAVEVLFCKMFLPGFIQNSS